MCRWKAVSSTGIGWSPSWGWRRRGPGCSWRCRRPRSGRGARTSRARRSLAVSSTAFRGGGALARAPASLRGDATRLVVGDRPVAELHADLSLARAADERLGDGGLDAARRDQGGEIVDAGDRADDAGEVALAAALD